MHGWWQDWRELIARQLARRWQARRGGQKAGVPPQIESMVTTTQAGDTKPPTPTELSEGTGREPVAQEDTGQEVPHDPE
jgi:hypothetical protein